MKDMILALGAGALLSACADSAQSVARARAANDLACPEASIVVREAVSGTVRYRRLRAARDLHLSAV